MYDETNVPGPEFRVRTVPRYIVTRYCHPFRAKDGSFGTAGHSEVIATLESESKAYEVARALAKQEASGASLVLPEGTRYYGKAWDDLQLKGRPSPD